MSSPNVPSSLSLIQGVRELQWGVDMRLLVRGEDSIQKLNVDSSLGLSTRKNVTCYPTMKEAGFRVLGFSLVFKRDPVYKLHRL